MIYYCHAPDEIPKAQYQDFREWMAFNEYHTVRVRGQDDPVYLSFEVKEYKALKGIRPIAVVEDVGELEIKLEFSD